MYFGAHGDTRLSLCVANVVYGILVLLFGLLSVKYTYAHIHTLILTVLGIPKTRFDDSLGGLIGLSMIYYNERVQSKMSKEEKTHGVKS